MRLMVLASLAWAFAGSTAVAGALPLDAARLLVQTDPGPQARVFAAATDLDGDGRDEWLVYMAGPSTCGTGGCPLYVLAPAPRGYRVVTRIGPVQPPVHVAASRSRGWRDLVVAVGGGGMPGATLALSFDGRSYPRNPTVPGPYVRTVGEPGSPALIVDFNSWDEGAALPVAAALAAVPVDMCATGPQRVGREIGRSPALAAQQRDVLQACERSQPRWAELGTAARRDVLALQRELVSRRDACLRHRQLQPCLQDALARRLVALRIGLGELGEVPTAVAYRCEGLAGVPVHLVFYAQAEPRAAVLTVGDRQTVLFAEPSGSGSRYAATGAGFWEHHGEALLTLSAHEHRCLGAGSGD